MLEIYYILYGVEIVKSLISILGKNVSIDTLHEYLGHGKAAIIDNGGYGLCKVIYTKYYKHQVVKKVSLGRNE